MIIACSVSTRTLLFEHSCRLINSGKECSAAIQNTVIESPSIRNFIIKLYVFKGEKMSRYFSLVLLFLNPVRRCPCTRHYFLSIYRGTYSTNFSVSLANGRVISLFAVRVLFLLLAFRPDSPRYIALIFV